MKKLLLVLVVFAAMLSATNGVYKYEGGRYDAPLYNDITGLKDTLLPCAHAFYTQNIKLDWTRLDGHFAVEYKVYVKHGTPTVDIYYEVAIDTLNYYGSTLIAGSITSDDSALVYITPIYGQYIRFYFDDAVCVADDTSKIKLRINGHWLGVNNDVDSLGHYPASYYLNNVSDSYGWLSGDSTSVAWSADPSAVYTKIKPDEFLMVYGYYPNCESVLISKYDFYSRWAMAGWWDRYNAAWGLNAADSLRYTTSYGHDNAFFGEGSGMYCGQGVENVGVGAWAGQHISADSFNTYIGYNAAHYLHNGSCNTVLGSQAMDHSSEGWDRTDTAYYNIVLGWRAFYNCQGDSNVIIGNNAYRDTTPTLRIRQTFFLDNSKTHTPLLYGRFDSNYVKVWGNFYSSGRVQADSLLHLTPLTADPTGLTNGDIWYIDKTNDTLFIYLKGAKRMIVYF